MQLFNARYLQPRIEKKPCFVRVTRNPLVVFTAEILKNKNPAFFCIGDVDGCNSENHYVSKIGL
jgi:hypothetical protein